jgi:hypothetical protein
MPIGRYIAWVGTSLLVLLFAANWFFPQPLAEPTSAETNRPTIRISSMQQPPERIVIDTSLPTIIPPPTLAADAISDEQPPQVQAYASTIPHATVTGVETKKPKAKKKPSNRPASSAPAIAAESTSPEMIAPTTRLSFTNVISGEFVRELFNPR